MKCVNHPEVETDTLCAVCKASVCPECRVTLRDQDYCRSCLEEMAGKVNTGVNKQISAFWALALSLFPGAGYMYLGLMNRGLQIMVVFFGAIFVAGMTHIDEILPLVLPVVWFYSIFDTLQLTRQMREGLRVEDKPLLDTGGHTNWQRLLGYALIGLGALALLNNFLPYIFNYWMTSKLITPLIIIAIGVFILYRSLGRGRHNDGEGND